ncbi:PDZ domain-containing protein [Lysinibacillus sp. 3P01SB]|uniref:PDZ domain-containing protein n=1 Tax=Lysinibacillus sp. 3P01SB TaxID=3132284 RepID=UPI0039A64B07
MYATILVELLQGIGRFLINPLFYLTIMFAVLLGYTRVRRERRFFHIRVANGWSELKSSLTGGLLVSLVLSLVIVAAGLAVTPQFLLVLSVITIVGMILYTLHLLSSVILITASFMVLVVLNQTDMAFTFMGIEVDGAVWNDASVVPLCILAGLLVMVEGWLIRKKGAYFASPILEKTKRGMKAVAYLSKSVWLLPLLLVVPGEGISSYVPYWPQFTLGEESFSLVLFPLVIGFQQKVRKTLPIYFYPKLARTVTLLGVAITLGGITGYFMKEAAFIMLLAGSLIRLLITLQYKMQERADVYAVAPSSNGAMIAAVLPNSPAEKMGLVTGEVIKKVNGREVQTERELYEALQVNAAHCKIEVLDHHQELRLTQHVVHSDDHHGIGLLLAR